MSHSTAHEVAVLLREEGRAGIERQVREAAEYHALCGHNASAQYQRDLAQAVSARCAERDPRTRQFLKEVEDAVRAACDAARVSGDAAVRMVDHARAVDIALANLQTAVVEVAQ